MFITSLYAGILALWFLVLSGRVVARRRGEQINLGDGGDKEMQRRIRGQANFAEYVPIALLLMLILESGGVASSLLHLLGVTLLVSRLLHGYSFAFTPHFFAGRFWGTVLSFLVIAVAGALCAYRGLVSLVL